ncbi:MAG: hypothetical protein KF716_31575 [Anaerolineae bacterium]|nr:hypothetical protein [Anaerolineae bacterium]
MLSTNDAVSSYLQQIQPRGFPDLMAHVHLDLLALLDTYTSTFGLFETNIKTIQLPDDIATQYQSGIRNGIDKSHLVLNELMRELQSIDAGLTQIWMGAFLHDVRAPLGILKGWTTLLQDEFATMPTSPMLNRVKQLNQEMQSTVDRMYTIVDACAEYARTLRDEK